MARFRLDVLVRFLFNFLPGFRFPDRFLCAFFALAFFSLSFYTYGDFTLSNFASWFSAISYQASTHPTSCAVDSGGRYILPVVCFCSVGCLSLVRFVLTTYGFRSLHYIYTLQFRLVL
jgi:hypothetical protein